ncbi:enoyl-ACP reductase-like protein [Roseiarcus fermentans]|uniref:Enoyl-ACP reductase-like protein n=2 Tax=Roseiarcus fermentans TaxID=1473586 RepID=A0A366ECL0_9HYPH|nr:enoyl-ACP reductase-like protein [Roseiarcus fermentans]
MAMAAVAAESARVGDAADMLTAMTPLARLARPDEIASAALFLASDLSSYVAGIDLPVDGRPYGCLIRFPRD